MHHLRFSKSFRWIFLFCLTIALTGLLSLNRGAVAQQSPDAVSDTTTATEAPVVNLPTLAAGAPDKYVLEFNRSPVVGNRFRFDGIYDEARLRFTRPRHWTVRTAKVLLRYRHSPALYATRSNLTVLINGTSVGSVPTNQPENKIGEAVFDVPVDLLQNYNELVVAALQNNSPTCTQDPYDPSLWSEVLPDSRIVFDYQPQEVALDFNRYPYPIFDELSLEANRVAYLQPKTTDEAWLTAIARFHGALGRVAYYRALENRMVKRLSDLKPDEHLIIIGTPAQQPILKDLDLPFELKDDSGGTRFLDQKSQPIGKDTGVLMLTTALDNRVPVLVATGNSEAAVAKAVQFLVQSRDRQIGSGEAILVDQLAPVETPSAREWQGYLPLSDGFLLKDLQTGTGQRYDDVTVRGSHAPALEIDFRALPDDQFLPGNEMTLRYSYGPQVNPLTSMVEVQLDGVALEGARLTSVSGAERESLQVKLPEGRITPNSKLQVNFRLDPRERRSCSRVTDQQLWGTVHSDTSFTLQREVGVKLPNLKLLTNGFPFTAPQDLSSMAIALPDSPSTADLNLLLEVSERLGRLSKAPSIQFSVYRAGKVPGDVLQQKHLIGIGVRSQFPFPEALEQGDGFTLKAQSTRSWQDSKVKVASDAEGVIKQEISPWNRDRILLILSGQRVNGLDQVRTLFAEDPLFYQLKNDTVLLSANGDTPSPYDPNDYNLEFLQQTTPKAIVAVPDDNHWLDTLRRSWLFLAPAFVVAALLLYGVVQLLLNRLSGVVRDGDG
jgi:hypothetical protein